MMGNTEMHNNAITKSEKVMFFARKKFFNKGCLHGRQFFITKFLDDDDDDNEK
jgi:hypothetical protein